MVGRETVSKRPFNQSKYDTRLLRPTLEGEHYKFTILLPVTEFPAGKKDESKPVFTDLDLVALRKLFTRDFGGVTYTEDIKHPLLRGEWIDKTGRTVVNEHVQFEIYSQRNQTAIRYFTELKIRLMQHVKEVRHMEQEEIIIEKAGVGFIPLSTLEALRKEQKQTERIKYLRGE
jgi:hypothetical protein